MVFLCRERFPIGTYNKLSARKIGPCRVLRRIGDNTYSIAILTDMKSLTPSMWLTYTPITPQMMHQLPFPKLESSFLEMRMELKWQLDSITKRHGRLLLS